MSKYEIPFLTACIQAFGKRFAMTRQAAFQYLHKHKGLAFLIEFYDVEHLQSMDELQTDWELIMGQLLQQVEQFLSMREILQTQQQQALCPMHLNAMLFYNSFLREIGKLLNTLALDPQGLGAIFISLMMYIEAKSKIFAKKVFINLRTSEKYCIFAPI